MYYGVPGKHRRAKRLYGEFLGPGDLAFDIGAHARLLTVLARQHAETDRGLVRQREFLHGPRGLLADQVIVARLAADDAAKRHIAVIGDRAAASNGDRGRYLQGTGHFHPVECAARSLERGHGAFAELFGNVLVIACLDNQHMGGTIGHPPPFGPPPPG